jgi:hypothetical protein
MCISEKQIHLVIPAGVSRDGNIVLFEQMYAHLKKSAGTDIGPYHHKSAFCVCVCVCVCVFVHVTEREREHMCVGQKMYDFFTFYFKS